MPKTCRANRQRWKSSCIDFWECQIIFLVDFLPSRLLPTAWWNRPTDETDKICLFEVRFWSITTLTNQRKIEENSLEITRTSALQSRSVTMWPKHQHGQSVETFICNCLQMLLDLVLDGGIKKIRFSGELFK